MFEELDANRLFHGWLSVATSILVWNVERFLNCRNTSHKDNLINNVIDKEKNVDPSTVFLPNVNYWDLIYILDLYTWKPPLSATLTHRLPRYLIWSRLQFLLTILPKKQFELFAPTLIISRGDKCRDGAGDL